MKTNYFDRRRFLKWSAASLSALGLGGMPPFLKRTLALPKISDKKILFIFLRGGMDGIQTLIPYGDPGDGPEAPDYMTARPTLREDPADAHPLDDDGFCSLNPNMHDSSTSTTGPKLLDVFKGEVDERGPNLACVHRVGYAGLNRSHFSGQQFWENAVPGDLKLEEGFLNRYLSAYPDEASPMQAAGLNGNQMVILKGSTLVPVLRSVDDYALPSNVQLGTFPTPANPLGTGLKGAYAQAGFDLSTPYEDLTYTTGTTLLDNLQFFEDNVRSVKYEPEVLAQPYYGAIGNRGFASFVQDSARLLKQVDSLQIIGCNQGNYDTHGAEDRNFPTLVRDLSLALTALYHDLKPIWDRVLVFTLSEFGRTTLENGNRGTDHAEAVCQFFMGGPVNGGVYNCDETTWENGAMFSTSNGRYLSHRTDFRQVYAEIIQNHLGDPGNNIDTIIPNFSTLAAENQNGYFTPLNILA